MPETIAAIEGGYGYANLGDDVLMLSAVSCLLQRFSLDQISIPIVPGGEYVTQWLPECRVLLRNQQCRTQHLLYGGGTLFFSFSTNSCKLIKRAAHAVRLIRNPLRLYHRLLHGPQKPIMPLFKAENCYALGIGLGPFENVEKEEIAKNSLKDCEYIAVRDTESAAVCRSWGIHHVVQGADLCFASRLWTMGHALQPELHEHVRRIGFVVRDWKHTSASRILSRNIPIAVDLMAKLGFKITYILFQNDNEWKNKLKGGQWPVLAYDPWSETPVEFCKRMCDCDLIISSRAHGAMLASLLGIPSICVGIEPKLQLLSEILGMTALWSAPFDPLELIELVKKDAEDIKRKSREIRYVVARQSELTEDTVSAFLQHLDAMCKNLKQNHV